MTVVGDAPTLAYVMQSLQKPRRTHAEEARWYEWAELSQPRDKPSLSSAAKVLWAEVLVLIAMVAVVLWRLA